MVLFLNGVPAAFTAISALITEILHRHTMTYKNRSEPGKASNERVVRPVFCRLLEQVRALKDVRSMKVRIKHSYDVNSPRT